MRRKSGMSADGDFGKCLGGIRDFDAAIFPDIAGIRIPRAEVG